MPKVQVKQAFVDDGEFKFKKKGEYNVFVDGKYVGRVWKGMSGHWYPSGYNLSGGPRFKTRKAAVNHVADPTCVEGATRTPDFE